MKTNLLARVWSTLAAVALISAACVPIPDSPPPVVAPTASVFLPNVEASGVTTSPLQPTIAPTISALIPATSVPTHTLVATSATATAGATLLATHTPMPTATPLPALIGPVWQWVSSTLKDGPSLAPGDPGRYTFQLLGDGNALIQADCNFGTGSYTESADSFSFTAIGTTKMACPPDSQDSAFLGQLRYIASYRFESGELVISLQDDAGTMRLRPGPAEAAAGAAVTEVVRARTGTPGSAAALLTSTVTPLPTPTPLRTATPASMLLGTPVPLASPVAAATVLPALSGTNWMLVSLTANSQVIPPVGSTPITLEIDPDGKRISGSTGCNQYRATLSTDAKGAAVLGPALTTKKACAADLMVQEVELIDALLRTRSYVLRGNELTFVDVAGNSLIVLVRK